MVGAGLMRVLQGSATLLKRGRPTEKNPDGVTTEIPMPWRVVRGEDNEPFAIAAGANGGMQYALKITKGQMLLAIEEIERQEDQIRAEIGERWGG